ncbi:MAG: hypothetical protein ACI94O_001569 [Octadecabacter sp.]
MGAIQRNQRYAVSNFNNDSFVGHLGLLRTRS